MAIRTNVFIWLQISFGRNNTDKNKNNRNIPMQKGDSPPCWCCWLCIVCNKFVCQLRSVNGFFFSIKTEQTSNFSISIYFRYSIRNWLENAWECFIGDVFEGKPLRWPNKPNGWMGFFGGNGIWFTWRFINSVIRDTKMTFLIFEKTAVLQTTSSSW